MASKQNFSMFKLGRAAEQGLGRLEVLALFPLVALTASLFGFDNVVMLVAVGLSALLALGVVLGRASPETQAPVQPAVGHTGLIAMLNRVAQTDGRDTACFLVQVDEWQSILDQWGHDTSRDIFDRVEDRLRASLRDDDLLIRLGDARFGIVLRALPAARLSLRDMIASRMANAVAEPIALQGAALRLTASVGHSALLRNVGDPATATFEAAETALADALRHGPSTVRAYAPGLGRHRKMTHDLTSEVEAAIHAGDITAWYQPQICIRTGAVAGMEALARWKHPVQGLLGPTEFLPAAEAAGMMPLLGQKILHNALKNLSKWDKLGLHLPSISINFSSPELRDPNLVKEIERELERYNLTADRLRVEVLETVAAQTEDDAILATLDALRSAGHPLDLDDFGIGQASLHAVQRFGIHRLKIDRSFVIGVDGDGGKRRSIDAILAMASALGLQTLAEGVENEQEADALASIGCTHIQGFHVARPLKGSAVADWVRHHAKSEKTIQLSDHRPA